MLVRIIKKIKKFMKNPKTTQQFANLKKFGAGQSGGFVGLTAVVIILFIAYIILYILGTIISICITYALLYGSPYLYHWYDV